MMNRQINDEAGFPVPAFQPRRRRPDPERVKARGTAKLIRDIGKVLAVLAATGQTTTPPKGGPR